MSERPAAVPRLERDSDRLLLAAGKYARDEGVRTIPVNRLPFKDVSSSWDEIAFEWSFFDFGRRVDRDDGFTTHRFFELSDAGFAEFDRLRRQNRWRDVRRKLSRHALSTITVVAAVIAAVAAVASAYFSYLALPGN